MPKRTITALLLSLASISAHAYDNGPQVLACDYQRGAIEDTDICLLTGSGTNQGISWQVFKWQGTLYRHFSSAEKQLEIINTDGDIISTLPVQVETKSCRPGGREASVFTFSNGDYVCLYWPR
ncbi:MAG: hypothetical protein ACRCYV_11250 [Aeromonas sp.]